MAVRFADLKVMIVDDEEFSLKFLGRVLEAIGISNVIQFSNAEEALARLQELGSDELDLLITDIEMPDMTGFELSRRIRYGLVPHFKNLPIMILSGEFSDENVRHARTHKINALVAKPPSVDVLRLEIQEVLRQQPPKND